MTVLLDLDPAARQMAKLVRGVADDQLTAPTPCGEYSLGDLVDHVSELSQAFTAAATKEDLGPGASQGPSPDAARLGDDWRTRIPEQLAALVEAWRDPKAWEGTTRAGGVELPAEMAGKVALNELVIHGWDIARASGQPFEVDPQALDASMEFVSLMSTEDEAAREGLFGPVIAVPDDAPLVDRVIGLSGRYPSWRA